MVEVLTAGLASHSAPFYIQSVSRETTSFELRRWVVTWREAGEALARVKRRELEALRTPEALEHLADVFEAALRDAPRTRTSGLVEQQRLFARLRR